MSERGERTHAPGKGCRGYTVHRWQVHTLWEKAACSADCDTWRSALTTRRSTTCRTPFMPATTRAATSASSWPRNQDTAKSPHGVSFSWAHSCERRRWLCNDVR